MLITRTLIAQRVPRDHLLAAAGRPREAAADDVMPTRSELEAIWQLVHSGYFAGGGEGELREGQGAHEAADLAGASGSRGDGALSRAVGTSEVAAREGRAIRKAWEESLSAQGGAGGGAGERGGRGDDFAGGGGQQSSKKGQNLGPQAMAARMRWERVNARMRVLQGLVPGAATMTPESFLLLALIPPNLPTPLRSPPPTSSDAAGASQCAHEGAAGAGAGGGHDDNRELPAGGGSLCALPAAAGHARLCGIESTPLPAGGSSLRALPAAAGHGAFTAAVFHFHPPPPGASPAGSTLLPAAASHGAFTAAPLPPGVSPAALLSSPPPHGCVLLCPPLPPGAFPAAPSFLSLPPFLFCAPPHPPFSLSPFSPPPSLLIPHSSPHPSPLLLASAFAGAIRALYPSEPQQGGGEGESGEGQSRAGEGAGCSVEGGAGGKGDVDSELRREGLRLVRVDRLLPIVGVGGLLDCILSHSMHQCWCCTAAALCLHPSLRSPMHCPSIAPVFPRRPSCPPPMPPPLTLPHCPPPLTLPPCPSSNTPPMPPPLTLPPCPLSFNTPPCPLL
ncbi:unnamed protein product [Closterium sp. NIES-64]|nr:unnamed protein product [Closterium sp. NIES-64]